MLVSLPDRFAVARFAPDAPVPDWVSGAFTCVTRTPDELSIVCPEAAVPAAVPHEPGWCGLKVQGPLGFGMTGVLAALVAPLAAAGVSIFVVATFDTDYLFVKSDQFTEACEALEAAGHTIRGTTVGDARDPG